MLDEKDVKESEETEEEVVEEEKAEETSKQETAKEDKAKAGWDKERQRVDQLQANVRKLADEKQGLAEQLSTMSKQSSGLADKITALESKLAEKQEIKEQVDLDPDLYDPKLIKTINLLKSELASAKSAMTESNKKIDELSQAKEQIEAERLLEREQKRRDEIQEKILSDLDADFGAKFRNEAMKMAQKEVDETGKPPVGEFAVYHLLKKYYKEAASKAPKKTDTTKVRVDTGSGGVSFNDGEVKEGSRKDVLNQLRSKIKGKGFTMPGE